MAIIDATPGGPASNSYATLAEANAYFATRLPLAGWENADDKSVLLIMATRLLDNALQAQRVLVPAQNGMAAHYRTKRAWTGTRTTAIQKLAWPRVGMRDGNGNPILETIIPSDLIEATSEFAGQLGITDRTLENDVVVQGITSVRAGSVSLTFKDLIESKIVPDSVWDLMPPSWFTDDLITPAISAEFDVVSW